LQAKSLDRELIIHKKVFLARVHPLQTDDR